MKLLLTVLGSIALGLAILGLFLPLLPTTPFLLLASACYVRSSDRLHDWLLSNRVFGKYIDNLHHNRGIPLRAKVMALLLMWASLAYSAYVVGPIWAKALLAVPGIGVTIYLLRMKTLRPD